MTTQIERPATLKGAKYYGEFCNAGRDSDGQVARFEHHGGFLYRLADGRFAVAMRQEMSGKLLSLTVVDGKAIEKFDTLNLGYAMVTMYRFRGTQGHAPRTKNQ